MTKQTAPERLLHYFLDREGQPISTFTLERIAGRRSWRSQRGKLVAVLSFYTLVKVPRRAA